MILFCIFAGISVLCKLWKLQPDDIFEARNLIFSTVFPGHCTAKKMSLAKSPLRKKLAIFIIRGENG